MRAHRSTRISQPFEGVERHDKPRRERRAPFLLLGRLSALGALGAEPISAAYADATPPGTPARLIVDIAERATGPIWSARVKNADSVSLFI